MAELKTRPSLWQRLTGSFPVERSTNIISISSTEQRAPAPGGYSNYTRMYKQHAIVRATVDKLAKTCVASGIQFIPRDSTKDLNQANALVLSDTFARSKIIALLRSAYVDLLVYGDAYWFLTKSRLGVPYQFVRVAPSSVQVIIDIATREPTQYIVRSVQGQETSYKPEEFIHFKMFDPNNDVYGLSPLESLTSTVAQDLFAQTYNEAFFANNAQTGIVFNMKNASREEVERNREFLRKDYIGTQNAHKPLLLEGDVSVSRSVSTPADMQFIEGRKALMTEILAVYDMPYTKLGGSMESANRSQGAENDKSFRTEAIVPLQSIVEEQINEHLIFLIFGFDDTLFQHKDVDFRDEAAQMKVYIEGLDKGIFTIDYVRAKLGQKPIPGGDIATVATPLGLMPVSEIANAAKAILDAKTVTQPVPGQSTPGGPQAKPPKTKVTNV